jgi:hypothetical protein
MSAKDSGAAWELRVFIREKLIEFLQNNYPESLPKTRVIIEGEGKISKSGDTAAETSSKKEKK